jgi:hypothetical protein
LFAPPAPSFNGSSASARRSARVDFDNGDRRQSPTIAQPRRRAVSAQTDLS